MSSCHRASDSLALFGRRTVRALGTFVVVSALCWSSHARALEQETADESFLVLHGGDGSVLDGSMFSLNRQRETDAYGFSIAPGLDLGFDWGLEIDLTPRAVGDDWRNGEPAGDDVKSITIEGKVDLDTGTGFTPYVVGGAGLGYGTGSRIATPTDEDLVTTLGVGTGVTYGFTPRWDVELGYRALFSDGQGAETGGEGSRGETSHTLDIGLRYRF